MEWKSLPVELQEEILSRVPSKSLARLRSTSKQWNALLKSGRFAKIQYANAPTESLIIMLKDSRVYLASVNLHGVHNNVAPSIELGSRLYLKDPHICNVFHCDGLLLLCTIKENRLEVWNPCSGETKLIKPRHNYYKELYFYALGYDDKSSCKKYKVLRMDREGPVLGEYEIYDFTNDSWRVLGAATEWIFGQNNPVSMKGNTYWVVYCTGWPYNKVLLSFDFSREKFQSLSLPQPFPSVIAALSVVREEKLCLLGSQDLHLHIWVTTSIRSVMSWSKFLKVQTNNPRWDMFPSGMSFLADEHNKVVVCCRNRILHIGGEINHIQHVDDHGRDFMLRPSCSVLLNYVPSLAQIQ
ncbi:F-box domain [Arabidopsis thaliana x Arabidopsis arenosa]|uniref:F-box domain n=1 Tax=Arabidopsis thaliana x Arabidopsis arenosa TaxID=1240361 RepID=A0A8T2AW39_9BRAS|nr:F-box domain [Arabidopsis thaliana x Arabidopsis arenosa]